MFEGIERPSLISYALCLKACTASTLFHFGRRVHAKLQSDEALRPMLRDASIQIALINLYGKCASLAECEAIFEEIKGAEPEKYETELRIWNAMLKAFGRNGDPKMAMDLLQRMRRETNLKADIEMWKTLIAAFAHCGEHSEAKRLWTHEIDEELKYEKRIVTAMTDCYARNGAIDDALQIIVEFGRRRRCTESAEDVEGEDGDKDMWLAL